MRWTMVGICVISLALCAGCGQKGPPRKQTFRVTGKVTVDGQQPPDSVQIECHNVAGMDAKIPTFSQCVTNPDGSFEIATYQQGDGVPAGDYVLTFKCQEFNLMSRSYGGPDKLNNRYADPKTSEFKFSVVNKSVDLGTIALTTK